MRQADPERGPSPWKRGVRAERQVLICPDCQAGRDWAADLDRCRSCGAVRLVRRLGEVECKTCGAVRETIAEKGAHTEPSATAGPLPATTGPASGGAESAPGLAAEVERALARVLGAHRVPP